MTAINIACKTNPGTIAAGARLVLRTHCGKAMYCPDTPATGNDMPITLLSVCARLAMFQALIIVTKIALPGYFAASIFDPFPWWPWPQRGGAMRCRERCGAESSAEVESGRER
eukprot:4417385-Pleurochrysis_carterae.AAC.8